MTRPGRCAKVELLGGVRRHAQVGEYSSGGTSKKKKESYWLPSSTGPWSSASNISNSAKMSLLRPGNVAVLRSSVLLLYEQETIYKLGTFSPLGNKFTLLLCGNRVSADARTKTINCLE